MEVCAVAALRHPWLGLTFLSKRICYTGQTPFPNLRSPGMLWCTHQYASNTEEGTARSSGVPCASHRARHPLLTFDLHCRTSPWTPKIIFIKNNPFPTTNGTYRPQHTERRLCEYHLLVPAHLGATIQLQSQNSVFTLKRVMVRRPNLKRGKTHILFDHIRSHSAINLYDKIHIFELMLNRF